MLTLMPFESKNLHLIATNESVRTRNTFRPRCLYCNVAIVGCDDLLCDV